MKNNIFKIKYLFDDNNWNLYYLTENDEINRNTIRYHMDNVHCVKEAKALMNNAQILINLDANGKEIVEEFYNNIKQ